jgi:hypothetical protein
MDGIKLEDRKLLLSFVGAQREAGKPARVLMAIRGTAFLSVSSARNLKEICSYLDNSKKLGIC